MYKLAIGDIHGKLSMLEALVKFADENIEGYYQKIFLGDYIDRGEDSKGVLDYIRKQHREENAIILPGNHERMMIDAWERPENKMHWLNNGGEAALKSFGINQVSNIPEEYIHFVRDVILRKENLFYQDEFRIFVHGGIGHNNHIPMALKDENLLLWMREPDHIVHNDQEYLVVHGHTPRDNIFWRGNRMNLDTGAVFRDGKLSAALFNDEQKEPLRYFQTSVDVMNGDYGTKMIAPVNPDNQRKLDFSF